jgi:hypothetical protein
VRAFCISASVPTFCGRVVSIPVLVKSPPGAYRHPPPPSMVLACRLLKSVRLRGERLKYSGDCVVKGLLSAGVRGASASCVGVMLAAGRPQGACLLTGGSPLAGYGRAARRHGCGSANCGHGGPGTGALRLVASASRCA